MGEYTGAIDLGTTGVRCVIFDRSANPVAADYRELRLSYPQSGWVEQDPQELFQATLGVVRGAVAKSGIDCADISSFGITNQRETTIVWDRDTGKPIHPAIVWQDRRTAMECERLRSAGIEGDVRARTGLPLDPYFSASKLSWILQHVPQARVRAQKGELLFGTPDTWLLWKLTGHHLTDTSNASRTLLFNIAKMEWDDELLRTFSIPRQCLPRVLPSLSPFAAMKREFFHRSIPISGVLGDQQAALFGHIGLSRGALKVTWGTGAFLLMNTGDHPVESSHQLLSTVFYSDESSVSYGLEGAVFVAGAAIQWLRDGLGIISDAAESEDLARSVESTGGAYFVPALTGLGAPYWDPHARGTIVGITRGTGRAQIVRAALESIAYQTQAVVEAMEDDLGYRIDLLHVDGGAARNDFLCQFQSDILGIPIVRPGYLEMTARGAALAAGLTSGVWGAKDDLTGLAGAGTRFEPMMNSDQRDSLLAGWQRAVERAKGWDR